MAMGMKDSSKWVLVYRKCRDIWSKWWSLWWGFRNRWEPHLLCWTRSCRWVCILGWWWLPLGRSLLFQPRLSCFPRSYFWCVRWTVGVWEKFSANVWGCESASLIYYNFSWFDTIQHQLNTSKQNPKTPNRHETTIILSTTVISTITIITLCLF